MDGGKGNDTYKVQAAKGNSSTITDAAGKDKIQLFGVTNVTKLNNLSSLKFTLSKNKKTLSLTGINKRSDTVLSFTSNDKFKNDILELFNAKDKNIFGGNIDLANIVNHLKAGKSTSFTFMQKGHTIKIK